MKKPQIEFKIYNHLAWKYYKDSTVVLWQIDVLEFVEKWAIEMQKRMKEETILTESIVDKSYKKMLQGDYTPSVSEFQVIIMILSRVWWYGSQLEKIYLKGNI